MVKVDKDVPIPTTGGGRVALYPWREMEVGHSFVIPKKFRWRADMLARKENATDINTFVAR